MQFRGDRPVASDLCVPPDPRALLGGAALGTVQFRGDRPVASDLCVPPDPRALLGGAALGTVQFRGWVSGRSLTGSL